MTLSDVSRSISEFGQSSELHARAARALASEVKSAVFGVTMIHALLVFGAWGDTSLVLHLLAAMAVVTGLNVWLVCYSITTAKVRTILGMLSDSDEQRREVERAHAELARANERIKQDMVLLRKTEMELRQAQKLEAVGRLASGIAHEINTPVQFVGDSVHFLQTGVEDLTGTLLRYRELLENAPPGAVAPDVLAALKRLESDADVDYLSGNLPLAATRAREGLDRVVAIVRSMKEFAHPDQATKTFADINRSVLATLTIARNEYKYVADARTELGVLPPVLCYAGELNQVLLNLIVNAAHAIADAPRSGEKGTIVVRTSVDGPFAVMQVSDTGTGIPESVREHIFEPFFTTKEVGKGTGQGLTLARAVVERHHGTISFETELGKGTTFTIRIPHLDTPASRSGKEAA